MALDVALTSVGLDRRDIFLVSRGDSTLRGHGFLEPSVLANSFGPFDATFHCPAFWKEVAPHLTVSICFTASLCT